MIISSLSILLMSACAGKETPNEDNPSENNTKELTVTGTALEITESTAVLTGYANPTPDLGNVTMGVLCSTSSDPSLDNSMELTSKELDNNNMYKTKATNLSSNTQYYFKSFIQYGGVYRFGSVKSFKTLDFTSVINTNEPTGIGMYNATINGSLNVDSNASLDKQVWFLFGNSETLDGLKKDGQKYVSSVDDNGQFSYNVQNLQPSTKYSYAAFAIVHDKELSGQVVSFTTDGLNASVITNDATEIGLFSVTLNPTFPHQYITRLCFLVPGHP